MKSQKKKQKKPQKENEHEEFSELETFRTQSMSVSDNLRIYLMSESDNVKK